ncbi:hypothetical protein [Streptosporangium sp. OZ121]|uniref:hypothetical protein n=1 Tax=Streptosporangium sp. OZ121 TaxID=3444183 RepID=UPI003F7B0D5C
MAEIWTVWDAELSYTETSLTQSGGERPEQRAAPDGAEPLWGVYRVKPNNETHMHIFPHSTFEWRAAEYGIDPDDLETLLDVILHEPWIPSLDDPFLWENPDAVKVAEAMHGLPTCWTPGVPDAVRLEAHLTRINAVKEHRVRLEPEKQQTRQEALAFVGATARAAADPLEPIKSLTRLDPLRVKSRSLAVARYRESLLRTARPTFDSKPAATFVGRQRERAA